MKSFGGRVGLKERRGGELCCEVWEDEQLMEVVPLKDELEPESEAMLDAVKLTN